VLSIQEQPNTAKTAPSTASGDPRYDAKPNHVLQEAPQAAASTSSETDHPVSPRPADNGEKENLLPSSQLDASSSDGAREAEILEIEARKAETLEIIKKHQASHTATIARFKEVSAQLADMLAEYPIEERRKLLRQSESRLKDLLPPELLKQAHDMLIADLREKGIEIE
jgi:hypothetical protein